MTATTTTTPTLEELRKEFAKMLDRDEPLDSRMREMYRLKESYLSTVPGVMLLLEAVDTTDSVLLQHEMAYNVGQSGLEDGVPGLARIVRDAARYDPVTRHEAAESLGALGFPSAIPVLQEFADPAREPAVAVRETCELALARIAMAVRKGQAALAPPADCPYVSIDPSPAFSPALMDEAQAEGQSVPQTVPELAALLLDQSGKTPLYTRYMAMFSLRNIGNADAIAVLTRALREDQTSALFRHEVAFVLGQLERPATEAALIAALRDENEAAMVRHEAAIALGAIADPKTLAVLEEYATHKEPLVADSCVVALEMYRYWSKFNNLGKADGGEAEAQPVAAAQ